MHITIVFSIFFCELLSLQENMILSIIMSKQMNTIFSWSVIWAHAQDYLASCLTAIYTRVTLSFC